KVLVAQRFRGREIAHKEIGLERLKMFADSLSDIAKVEQTPRWMGRQASIILAPDKPKVEAVKRRLAKEQAAREGITEEAAAAAADAEAKAALAKMEAEAAHDEDEVDDEAEQPNRA